MDDWKDGGFAPHATAHACARGRADRRRGAVLLAVLVFIALLLPLITLVLTSINTESVATAEAINAVKSEMAAEKALNDAISLVVLEKSLPAYYTSVAQPSTAVIVTDGATGLRRNLLPDNGGLEGSGLDTVLGTNDDYWIGPRLNGSFFAGTDDATAPRNFGYDFSFINKDGPTYLGQGWSFSSTNESYLRSPFAGQTIWFLNQFVAVSPDDDNNGVDQGYDPNLAYPFPGSNDPVLHGPGYYLHADEPRDIGVLGNGPVARTLQNAGGNTSTKAWMLNAKVNLYESVFSDLGRGPIPSNLLKSYANVTDEAGRLNLNIFAKKVRVWAPETSDTDYDLEGYATDDFNLNQNSSESGWKWMNNPLFPDKDSTRRLRFDPVMATFTDLGPIDFGSMTAAGTFGGPDGISSPELGETVQHFYAGDTNGNGIPDSIESMRNSIEMLMSLPGINGAKAIAILEYLNPSQDYFSELGQRLGFGPNYYDPSAGAWPPLVDPSANPPSFRQDALNLTPAIVALELDTTGGTVNDFYWNFGNGGLGRNYDPDNEDDLPLPPPRTLATVDELLNVRGSGPLGARISERDLDRLRDHVTVYSYDTNVIANYIQDVSEDTDLVNAYLPGDPNYAGAALRSMPNSMRDTDNLPNLRYDVDRFVFASTMSEYRQSAEEMYAHLRAHLPRPVLDKITLPVVDRMGRAGAEDHLTQNNDPKYDPTATTGMNQIYVPHRDGDSRVYNVGAFGREDAPGAGIAPAGYPALNPEFSLDSCLSAVLYRNGTVFETDDYSYNPDHGAWRPFANRGLLNFFPFGVPWFLDIFGPFADQFRDFLEPNNNPDPNRGYNMNAQVPAHGRGVYTAQNLLQPGSFDSTADLLNVPLYQFGRMSVSLMADPPSDYRFDLNGDGSVDPDHPENGLINYFISFSDVVDLGWYLENVDPAGPDGRVGTADDPDMTRVLYKVRFTPYNRPSVTFPSDGGPVSADAVEIDLTPMQLRTLGGGPDSGNNEITIAAFDNAGNRNFLWPNPAVPQLQRLALPLSWRDVPEPEAVPGSHALGRPNLGSDWPGGQPAHWQAWAYDPLGDPYMTSRVEVVKWDDDNNAPAVPEARTDEIAKVFVQYNQEAEVPFMVSILPVRISGDEYEMRSAVGGYRTTNGAFLLYDWSYDGTPAPLNDLPGGFDGVWPQQGQQPNQANDPRVIRLTNMDPGGTIALRVYDLRRFGGHPGMPIPTGYPALGAGVWDVATGSVRKQPPPPFPNGFGGLYPPVGTPGYTADIQSGLQVVTSPTAMRSSVTVEEPTIFADDNNLRVIARAAGGELPYTYQVSIYDPQYGEPANPGTPYLGPDGAGAILSFPGVAVPPRPSRVDGALNNARAYSAAAPANALWRRLVLANTSNLEERFIFRPGNAGDPADVMGQGAMPAGDYWVEVRVSDADSNPIDYSYTKLTIGTDRTPPGSSGLPPEMNLSVGTHPLSGGGKGFTAVASVDGGDGGHSFYWEVRRPVYNNNGPNPVIIGEEVVNSSAPFVGLTASDGSGGQQPMTSNQRDQATFQFVPGSVSDGVYFVHCWVLDNAAGQPGVGETVIAHDVAAVTLYDFGSAAGGPALDSLARTPMAVLHAVKPGNIDTLRQARTRPAASVSTGGNQPYIGVAAGLDLPAIDSDVAARGSVITIRGFNFEPVAGNNIVHFHGGATARAIGLATRPEMATVGGNTYQQQELLVRVPDGSGADGSTGTAHTGLMYVRKTSGGTSAGVFFQTGFEVSFDLIGMLSGNDAPFLRMDLDFQGDGKVDISYDSSATPNTAGGGGSVFTTGSTEHRGILTNVIHDYAADGIGNYTATLTVTDTISGRKQVSRQLIMITDGNQGSASVLSIAAGAIDAVAGNQITDNEANFVSSGVTAGDVVVNLDNPTEQAVVNSRDSNTQLTLANSISAVVGTRYEVRRAMGEISANAMLANIWPEVDIRSETFTSGPQGTAFSSTVGGALAAGVRYKWKVNDGTAISNIGGELVTSGWVSDPDVAGLRLIDTSTNFNTVGNRGVRQGDLVIVYPDGSGTANQSEANVFEVESPTTLRLVSPTDINSGLDLGGPVTRTGIADNAVPSPTELYDQTAQPGDVGPRPYDFDGGNRPVHVGQGGILPGDTAHNVTTGASAAVVAPDSPAEGILQTGALTGGIAIGGPKGAGRPITSGGTPSAGNLLVGQTWQNNGPPLSWSGGAPFPPGQVALGDIVELWQGGTAYDTVTGTWIGGTLVGSGTVTQTNVAPPGGNRAIRTGALSGWLPDPPSNQRYVIKDPGGNGNLWTAGDRWEVVIPANQLRRGYEYEIYTFNGFQLRSESDADYASENAVVHFDLEMTTPFDLSPASNHASRVHVDWNGDGTVDQTIIVGDSTRTDNVANNFEQERVRLSHGFTAGEMMPVPPLPFDSQAQIRVEVWERGQTGSRMFPGTGSWYQLPRVRVGGDDYDTDLTTLNVRNFDNSGWRTVSMQAQTSQFVLGGAGVSNSIQRLLHASDQILVPPGMGGSHQAQLTSFVSYSKPFVTSNVPGVTSMRHQAVHGAGGALNWVSDANADGRWFSNDPNESPQGPNPANFHEFVFSNGPNQLNGPPVLIKGASFPLAVPGVGRSTTAGFQYYTARTGVYNGYGFVTDNLPSAERAFSFDTQALFLGRRASGTETERRPLGADFDLQPLIGTNSQRVTTGTYVTGGISNEASYIYEWQIEKISEHPLSTAPSGLGFVGLGGPYTGVSSRVINPSFELAEAIRDEPWYIAGGDGSGTYRLWLRVSDGVETVLTPRRDFVIVPVELRAYIMADPPSTSVGSAVQFHVVVDGGVGPYRVEIDRDGDGTYDMAMNLASGNLITASTSYNTPGVYDVRLRVTDSSSGTDYSGTQYIGTSQPVAVADTIPLNASLLVNPPSGVAPFLIDVHYAVAGGSPLSGDEYNVTLQLVNTDGTAQPAVTRRESTSLGADRMPDDPRRPNGDDDPVRFVIPSAGNYFVRLTVTDNDGGVVSLTENVYAAGYLAPEAYGNNAPRVARDANGRPLHAFRVWVDPFLNLHDPSGSGNYSPNSGYSNVNPAGQNGGRLMEADLQVIGDTITTDPNPNFRSMGLFAATDPATQQLYSVGGGGDFYDTFTPGRININTASEEVLTALFKRIIRTRAYHDHTHYDLNGNNLVDAGEVFYWHDLDGDGQVDWPGGDFLAGTLGPDERVRFARDYANDVYLTDAQARYLARHVVDYRSAFYSLHKPNAPDIDAQFGYRQSGYSASPAILADLGATFRADHLPVIGPWDGVNPHDYAVDQRDAPLRDPNAGGFNNAWDHMAASYYNFDSGAGNNNYMFYSPSDIAVVRDRWRANVTITDLPGGGSFSFDQFEPAGNYAKYLNDTVANRRWETGRPDAGWSATGLYPFANHYSRWSFDARNYFTYAGGTFDVEVSAGATPSVSWTQSGAAGTPADARNRIGIIESNGEVAYSYIPNPPFRSMFDLFKVIDALQEPMTYELDTDGQMLLEVAGIPGVDALTQRRVGSTVTNAANLHENARVFSGPSVFRYAAHWDAQLNEFVPVANYLDDIAPWITCRSYVFRVDASGGVATADTANASLDSAKIRRDRTYTAVIDTGKMYANRSESASSLITQIFGGSHAPGDGYRILSHRRNSR